MDSLQLLAACWFAAHPMMPVRTNFIFLQLFTCGNICRVVVAMYQGMQLTAGACEGDQLCNAKTSEQSYFRYGLNDNTLGGCVTPKPAGSSCTTNVGESSIFDALFGT